MTKAGKALVIFLAFGSVAFMGFAAVTTLGGTNWKEFLAEKNQDRHTKTLAEFVKSQDDEIKLLKADLQDASDKLKIANETREADIAAMKAREETLVAEIAEGNRLIIETTNNVVVTGEKVKDVQGEISDRREEVLKLRNQLKELRAQIDVTREEQERLSDRVIQAKELLKFAERRNKSLKAQ